MEYKKNIHGEILADLSLQIAPKFYSLFFSYFAILSDKTLILVYLPFLLLSKKFVGNTLLIIPPQTHLYSKYTYDFPLNSLKSTQLFLYFMLQSIYNEILRRWERYMNHLKPKRIVVKVGTSTLTHSSGHLNIHRMEKLCRVLSDLHSQGYEICLVTSGAIGAGMGKLGYSQKPKTLPEKQACAAVGQLTLSHLYQKFFSEYSKIVAQILLTKEDIGIRKRFLTIRDTFSALLEKKIIPIVNENDAVVTSEIKVGDNDTLSALTASLIEADLLILLTDIDGLYTDNPNNDPNAKLIERIETITPHIKKMAGGEGSKFGTGGMATKISAAEIATSYGVNTIIANGKEPDILHSILQGKYVGTLFVASSDTLSTKKHWITYGSKKSGTLVIDDGAAVAITSQKSLLSVGITEVIGEFKKNDTVEIVDKNMNKIAIGVTHFHSYEIEKIKGKKSSEIFDILGYDDYSVVIHIDNIYVLKGE